MHPRPIAMLEEIKENKVEQNLDMMKITFPDGSTKEYNQGSTGLEIVKSISNSLAKKILVAKVDGEIQELNRPIEKDSTIEFLKWDDEEGKSAFWHSSAHLLAEALEELYDGVKFGIGPAINNGFYYDVELGDTVITDKDLPKIEKKMKHLAQANSIFQLSPISKAEAIEYFTKKGDEYKLELIDGLTDSDITFCTQGKFTDLCRGGHIPHTGHIKAIKLLSIAGAYWRGDENNKQLTRIYGVSFPKQAELDEHLHMLEEAKKRDHRKLGKELELFMFSQSVGSGLPMWLPKGTIVRTELENFLKKEQTKRGYQSVITPHIGNIELYKTSGHYDKYGEDSFQAIETPNEGEEYLLKPMNCPHHCEIYNNRPYSYKELPVRFAEFGNVYRYEQSGELNGLTRVRGFTQDDAHIFCRPDQVKEEFKDVIDLVQYVFNKVGFTDVVTQISLRHKTDRSKYIGSEQNWDKAEQAIIEAVAEMGIETVVEYDEAAFYGPKLDFMVKDALGRSWQLGTIQVDYNLPERFDLTYVDNDNGKQRPVMIHRAPFGSMERFIAILIEHVAGNFPLWLAPTQVQIIPVSEKFMDYCEKVEEYLKKSNIRCNIDVRNERIGKKIRDAEVSKIPLSIVLGEKEIENNNLTVRKHGKGDLGSMSLDDFTTFYNKELNNESK